jgi:hypothetical protein
MQETLRASQAPFTQASEGSFFDVQCSFHWVLFHNTCGDQLSLPAVPFSGKPPGRGWGPLPARISLSRNAKIAFRPASGERAEESV